MNEQRVWELFKILLPIKLEDLDNPCDYQTASRGHTKPRLGV